MRRRAELGYLYDKRLKSYNHKYAYSSKLYSCMKNSLCSVWCGFMIREPLIQTIFGREIGISLHLDKENKNYVSAAYAAQVQ